ncbi:hypothetical protein [Agrobacterium rosae]|uniref:hypothetical protein n=1 Tax=Agrobacterium rosae TaxID=1972867 RepID=UPI003B9F0F38
MAGMPITLGVPMGTWLGTKVGWRTAFWMLSILTLGMIGWVLMKVQSMVQTEPFC